MGDVDFRMSAEQLGVAREWIGAKWATSPCPFHGGTAWELDPALAVAPVHVPDAMVVGGPAFVFLVLTCSICGYTVLVNAFKAGILQATVRGSDGGQAVAMNREG